MKVLSLFDGISCGQIALNEIGVDIKEYYASEIEPSAIKVTQHHFPNTIQIGDITKVSYSDGVLISENGSWDVGEIDLICAGSPCQSVSLMGSGEGLNGTSGLFFHFLRILKEVKPRYFLLENVKMRKEWEDVFTSHIGIEPIFIQSALVSAQSRKRLYWFGSIDKTEIKQIKVAIPADRKLTLKDILEPITEPKSILVTNNGEVTTDKSFMGGNESFREMCRRNKITKILTPKYTIDIEYPDQVWISPEDRAKMPKPKSGEGVRANRYRVEHIRGLNDKSRCIAASCSSISNTSGTGVFHNGVYRRLTCLECERLQTLPELKIIIGVNLCLKDSKTYVDVVEKSIIGQKLVGNAEKDRLQEFVHFVKNLIQQSNQIIKNTVVKNVGIQIQRPINPCTNPKRIGLPIPVKIVAENVQSQLQKVEVDFAQNNVGESMLSEKIHLHGRGGVHQKDKSVPPLISGRKQFNLSTNEIMQLVEFVEKGTRGEKDTNSISTILNHLDSKSIEQMLVILYYYAKTAIDGSTAERTKKESLYFSFMVGYTSILPESKRYHAIGNGWTVEVIKHILSFIPELNSWRTNGTL